MSIIHLLDSEFLSDVSVDPVSDKPGSYKKRVKRNHFLGVENRRVRHRTSLLTKGQRER